jgi:phosphopantothenoylcysteine decarboxylase/phosphopantothenate--cysteine ligase
MTQAATEFITPLTLATLSKRPALVSYTSGDKGEWNNHVELGLWADLMLIAPATANTLAQCAHGLCDNLLSACYLSARCPVFFAPAMDLDMYVHPATRQNMQQLRTYGNHLIEAEHGELASGLVGDGRLAEPERIVAYLEKHFATDPIVKGKRVLITAGPTQEALDPVRYISNHSTGKMGYAIAKAFALAGAEVTLISGPTSLLLPSSDIRLLRVQSASEMLSASLDHFDNTDLTILSAAVADYAPETVASSKIKKAGDTLSLTMVKTPDIAQTLGKRKKPHQLLVGFALETDNEVSNAIEKLHRKNFDYIVLNSLRDSGAGFAHDTNKITVIDKDEQLRIFDLKSKEAVAYDILTLLKARWKEA